MQFQEPWEEEDEKERKNNNFMIKKNMANFSNANQFMEETYNSNQALLHQMDSSCIDLENEGGSLFEVLNKHQKHYKENEME